MRLVQVRVPDDRLEAVTTTLDEEGIDHVQKRAWVHGEGVWLVEFPIPNDAIGYVLHRLENEGVDTDQYTTITSLESAMTEQVEPLQDRFADDFVPLTRPELRSKARDMSHDTRSFLVMIFLSAVIAVAGLLVESPAVVVGSMVIAPIVGPVLTAAVGAVTGDREMLLHSIWIQAAGLAVAIVGATAFSYGLQVAGFFPVSLDVSTIDLIALRLAPNFVTIVIGLSAGAAGAYGLTTKGPTSLIGVMIAAALIPAAATTGIAAVWGEYRIAIGSLLLLLLTMVVINGGAFAVLWWLEYRPETEGWLLPSERSTRWFLVVGTALVLLVFVGFIGVATYQQIDFERTVTAEVDRAFDDSEYEDAVPVAIRIQYSGVGPFGAPETITITVSRTADGSDPPQIAGELERRITESTGREIDVRVRFIEYQQPDEGDRSAAVGINPPREIGRPGYGGAR